ncbi:MAG: TlpA family protein disulfide reductase [Candidatus Omnitrophica bacterium]|nr:TlpA family protein disulfide reductase [Candidatus Omnitrophota bacterium]
MSRFLFALLFLSVLLAGCSGVRTKSDDHDHGDFAQSSGPLIDPPFLRRESAKERWERSKRPLPPLPERKQIEIPAPEPVTSEAEVMGASVSDSGSSLETGAVPSMVAAPPSESAPSPSLAIETGAPAGGELIPANEPPSGWPSEKTSPSATAPHGHPLDQITPEGILELVKFHKGRILLVNMWGIECGPCVEELPHLEKIHRAFRDRGLSVVGVNTDVEARRKDVEAFVPKMGLTFDNYLKAPGPDVRFRTGIDPDYTADPFTLIFNREGKKIATIADALSLENWTAIAQALVDGKPIPITKPDVIRLFN